MRTKRRAHATTASSVTLRVAAAERRPRSEHGEGGRDGVGMECGKVEGDGSGRMI